MWSSKLHSNFLCGQNYYTVHLQGENKTETLSIISSVDYLDVIVCYDDDADDSKDNGNEMALSVLEVSCGKHGIRCYFVIT